MMNFLDIEKLTAGYGGTPALRDVSLRAGQGITGLLGPNGAGKSTLIRVLLGMLRADSGSVRVNGHDPSTRAGRDAVRRSIGWMPEGDCLPLSLSAVECVRGLAELSGLERGDAMKRAHEVLDFTGLEEQRYRPVESLSLGMRQRVKLAQAIAHDPPLLLLDEPTNGMDPAGRTRMLHLLRALGAREGRAVLLCSHLLDDVEALCADVIVLSRGRLVQQAGVDALKGGGFSALRLRTSDDAAALSALLAAGFVARAHQQGIEVDLAPTDDADACLAVLADTRIAVAALARVRPSLEQAFMALLTEPAQ